MRALLILCALCATATAQPTAETLYVDGQAAYDKHDFATALIHWRASYKLSGESGLLFNLAQAYRQNGQCKEALFTYRRFIAIDPTATQHELANEFVRELAPLCETLPVAAAAVGTDAIAVARTLIADDGHSKRLAGLATAGTGAVLMTLGLVLGHHAVTLGHEVTYACMTGCAWSNEASVDSAGRRDATLGHILDGTGIAAIAGGAVLYYLGMRDTEILVTGSRGATLSWSISW